MSGLFRFQDSVTTASSHSSNVEQLRAVDKVVIFTQCEPEISKKLRVDCTYLPGGQHKPPWPLLESIDCLRLPKAWLSLLVSYREAQLDQSYRTVVVAEDSLDWGQVKLVSELHTDAERLGFQS